MANDINLFSNDDSLSIANENYANTTRLDCSFDSNLQNEVNEIRHLVENSMVVNVDGDFLQNLFYQDIEDRLDDDDDLESEDEVSTEHRELEDDNGNEERVPLYETAKITKEESDVLIMSYIIRHGVTDYGLEDLLNLIDCHLPTPLYPTKYKFLKNFPEVASFKTFFYCPDCLVLISFTANARLSLCSSCQKSFLKNSLQRNGHYFLHIPLKP